MHINSTIKIPSLYGVYYFEMVFKVINILLGTNANDF